MEKKERDLNLLFLEIKAASEKVNRATEELLAHGRQPNGQLNAKLLATVLEAQKEWTKATHWYKAEVKHQQKDSGR
ncbi:MAG: hypothetical protein JWO06_214 [Bacteroidota bacterium]|nr:hypothetical protein [Bacteroidota bacterium]